MNVVTANPPSTLWALGVLHVVMPLGRKKMTHAGYDTATLSAVLSLEGEFENMQRVSSVASLICCLFCCSERVLRMCVGRCCSCRRSAVAIVSQTNVEAARLLQQYKKQPLLVAVL